MNWYPHLEYFRLSFLQWCKIRVATSQNPSCWDWHEQWLRLFNCESTWAPLYPALKHILNCLEIGDRHKNILDCLQVILVKGNYSPYWNSLVFEKSHFLFVRAICTKWEFFVYWHTNIKLSHFRCLFSFSFTLQRSLIR